MPWEDAYSHQIFTFFILTFSSECSFLFLFFFLKNACVVNTRLSFSVNCPRSWRERRRLLNPTQIIFPRLSSLTPVPLCALDARNQIKIPFCGNKSAPEQTPPPPPPRVGWGGGPGWDGMQGFPWPYCHPVDSACCLWFPPKILLRFAPKNLLRWRWGVRPELCVLW